MSNALKETRLTPIIPKDSLVLVIRVPIIIDKKNGKTQNELGGIVHNGNIF